MRAFTAINDRLRPLLTPPKDKKTIVQRSHYRIAAIALPLLISGCGSLPKGASFFSQQDSAPAHPVDISHVANAIPRVEPHSRYGNPTSYVVFGQRYYVKKSSLNHIERGVASWYGTKFHGKRTSSGEPYDMLAMTAAHKSLPLPTYAEVTNLENGRKIIVKINDRGPFKKNRIIDLSYAAAVKLGITKAGTGLVEVRTIDPSAINQSNPSQIAPPAPKPAAAKNRAPPVAFNTPIPLAIASQTPVVTTNHSTAPQADKLKRIIPGQAVNIYLQVGAFGGRINAENLKIRIRDIETLPVSKINVTQGTTANNAIFRVRIGPIHNVTETDQLIKRLAQLGIENPHVIID
ncbi:MAG: septal ring lytic transglycosylase RlpA family protein [Thiotrichaceae bacterium]|nr:septal ring lytic transglycosylase RlpA family protein [Thiotrichaceae bacterium]